jgi:hypothetical protein
VNAVFAERGLDLFAQRQDKNWSLTDCISFVVMQDEQLTEAAGKGTTERPEACAAIGVHSRAFAV